MSVVSFVDLFWDVAGVFEQSDCLVIIAYSEEAAERISADSVDIGVIWSLEDTLDREAEFLRPSGPLLVPKSTGTGTLALGAYRVEEKLSCLGVDRNGSGIPSPVDVQKGRGDARVEAVEQRYLFALDLQELDCLRFAMGAVGYEFTVRRKLDLLYPATALLVFVGRLPTILAEQVQ
jgi:hypothetical protein